MAKLVDVFLKGGPVMWPILGLSILGLAILIWKAFEFRAGRVNAKGLTVVSTIITAEPMLGILGTVIGIMQTFGALNGTDANPLAATAEPKNGIFNAEARNRRESGARDS